MRGTLHIHRVPVALLFLAGLAFGSETNSPPSQPATSPVAYFRQLLVMTDSERAEELAKRPEAQRAGLEAKIEQYAAMPASERELRLRATELRYFLLPLMRLPPGEREARLHSVPDDIRDLVEDRLSQWTLIPPPFQEELLKNQATLQLFSRMNPESPATADELIRQMPASNCSRDSTASSNSRRSSRSGHCALCLRRNGWPWRRHSYKPSSNSCSCRPASGQNSSGTRIAGRP